MPVRAISNIEPYNNSPFPVTEDVYIKGGYRVVRELEDLDKIPEPHLKHGMLAYVQNEDKIYRLDRGLTTWCDAFDLEPLIRVIAKNIVEEFASQVEHMEPDPPLAPVAWEELTVGDEGEITLQDVACVMAVYRDGTPMQRLDWSFDIVTGQLTLNDVEPGALIRALVAAAPPSSDEIAPVLPFDPDA